MTHEERLAKLKTMIDEAEKKVKKAQRLWEVARRAEVTSLPESIEEVSATIEATRYKIALARLCVYRDGLQAAYEVIDD